MTEQTNSIHPPPDKIKLLQTLFTRRQYHKTKAEAEALTQIYPNSWLAWNFWAAAQGSLNEVDGAIQGFQKVIKLNPQSPHGFNNLGNMLLLAGNTPTAIECFERAISLDSHFAPAYSNLGAAYKSQGSWGLAVKNYQQAIALNPNSAEAHNNLGRLMLLQQNFAEAFDLLEYRWSTQKIFGTPYEGTKPTWLGEAGHSVLVWKEQGIGDEVMFSSLIWDIFAQVRRVIVECDERLKKIYVRSFPKEIKFISSRNELGEGEYDSQVAIGSLPRFFRRTKESFNVKRSTWLMPNHKNAARFKSAMGNGGKIIGISWSTASKKNNASTRNIELSELVDGIGHDGHTFVNLQYGDVVDEVNQYNQASGYEVIRQPNIDLFNDIDKLADLITACDAIVSIDNLTVHLAGALGVETHVLLPALPDERWGLLDNYSYWYGSVRLHRQVDVGSWQHCITSINRSMNRVNDD